MAHRDFILSRLSAFGSLAMGISLLDSAFEFFYVKVFLNIHKMDPVYFQAAIIIVMVYSFKDNPVRRPNTDFRFSSTWEQNIPYKLLGIFFLMPWFSWIEHYVFLGIYCSVCLRLWGELSPYRGLVYCSSLLEISNNEKRMKILRYTQNGNILGSSSIFFLYYFSNQLESVTAFQITSVIIAIVSVVIMLDFRITV